MKWVVEFAVDIEADLQTRGKGEVECVFRKAVAAKL